MSDLYMREVEVLIGDRKITSPEFQIHFQVNFSDDPEPNTGEILLFNLSDDTTNRIKKGENIILNAGYQGEIGTILAGKIEEVKGYREGMDSVTKLAVGDATEEWYRSTVNRTYKAGTTSNQIIKDLVGMFGLEIGEVQPAHEIIYTGGKSVSGMLQNVLRQIVNETGSKFYISNGAVFIRPYSKGTKTGFLLNSDTGLIESPQRVDGNDKVEYQVKCLLNHKIRTDSLIQVQSTTANGNYRVVSGKHICNDTDFITDMEVVGI